MKSLIQWQWVLLPLLVFCGQAQANEASIRDRLCTGAQLEVRLKSGVRVDCVTKTHAIEVDYSGKWAEAIGQSMFYARELNLRPGIILVCRAETQPTTCLTHGFRIEAIFSHWKDGLTLWRCDENANSLADCLRKELN